jgi:hypothetical protein
MKDKMLSVNDRNNENLSEKWLSGSYLVRLSPNFPGNLDKICLIFTK